MQDSQIIRTEYSDVMRKSYIDYAMKMCIRDRFCAWYGRKRILQKKVYKKVSTKVYKKVSRFT